MWIEAATATTAAALREVIAAVDDRDIVATLETIASDVDTYDDLVSARCDCEMEHKGHPAKPGDVVSGCGQAGAIRAPT